jgi:hypothetical protein
VVYVLATDETVSLKRLNEIVLGCQAYADAPRMAAGLPDLGPTPRMWASAGKTALYWTTRGAKRYVRWQSLPARK